MMDYRKNMLKRNTSEYDQVVDQRGYATGQQTKEAFDGGYYKKKKMM